MDREKQRRGISRRRFLKDVVLGGAAVGAGLTMAPGVRLANAAKKGVYTMKYDCYIGATAETAQLDNWFLDELAKRSDGRIQIKKFWSGSLHKVGQHLPAIRDGLSEISLISYGYYPSAVPLSRGLEWYYRGCDHADSLLYVCRDMYNATPELRREWEDRNRAKVLYFTNWSYCPFIMKEPLPDVAALEGRKVRGYGIGADTVNRLGGQGMPIVAGEVYTSLERGILDGAFAFAFITAEKMKLHEQAPYIVESGAGAHAPTTVVMNRKLWRSLPDDLKEVVNQTIADLYNWRFLELYTKLTEESVDKMVAAGAKFSTWSDSEIKKATNMVQPLQINEWVEKIAKANNFDGAAFQKKVDALIQKYEPGKLKNPWETYKQKYM
ncbi:C4-dicarboxylate ABC transporter substrate-binding protein [Desulfosarcina alkanivorans]|uniref:C4-dicarboxylate ABC transporter substrate-binding protein n=1 Tax=Desulfosarcina alkanivorans TaxID=571177 RepID=A0A5K7YSW2_9BACT|nr:TRAP transporter substrate-binding protein DctP [Desulfosarcina alkanivorans]BBO71485.1 C4-dicarboxylate ABC transporter substrate-binding protein [Desulfosarcina alkanivorans]